MKHFDAVISKNFKVYPSANEDCFMMAKPALPAIYARHCWICEYVTKIFLVCEIKVPGLIANARALSNLSNIPRAIHAYGFQLLNLQLSLQARNMYHFSYHHSVDQMSYFPIHIPEK